MKSKNWLKVLSCSVFAGLYLIVAVISLICSTEFFRLAHSGVMSWVLAIGFEIGAMSCLLSTLILPKKKLGLVWFMFIILTLFQCMGNMYAAFINLENFQDWIDMFGMTDMELIAQKRVLAGISGIILPLVALGFIRIMADVLQDGHNIEINDESDVQEEKPLFLSSEGQNIPELNENNAETNIEEHDQPVVYNEEKTEPQKQEEKKEESEPEIKEVKPVEKPEVNPEIKKETSKQTGRVWKQQLNAELG